MRICAIFTACGNSLQAFTTALPCYIFPVFLFRCFSVSQLAFCIKCLLLWVTAALHLSLFIKSMIGSVKGYKGNDMLQNVRFFRHRLSRQKTAGNAIHGKTCNLCEDILHLSDSAATLLGFWQDHNLTIKGDNGGNDLFALGPDAAKAVIKCSGL